MTMNRIEKGHYYVSLVAAGSAKRPCLVKALSVDKKSFLGRMEKFSHIPKLRKDIEIDNENVVAHLGENPHMGKVYGTDAVNIYKGRKTNADFGAVYWFYDAPKETKDKLDQSFSRAAKALKNAGLSFVIDPTTCIWEAIPYDKEKYSGMYLRSKDTQLAPHRFQIRPDMDPGHVHKYIVYHELGHHLHAEYCTGKKLNAEWIKMYSTTVAPKFVSKDKSLEFLEGLLGQAENLPSDYKSTLSEEDDEAYKMVLFAIKQQHSISVKELDLLFEGEFFDDIRSVWPTRGISKKDLAPLVSEYSCRSYKELFAESFAFYMCGMELPPQVTKLMEKSISFAKANREKR